jgi:hypothetical protein
MFGAHTLTGENLLVRDARLALAEGRAPWSLAAEAVKVQRCGRVADMIDFATARASLRRDARKAVTHDP